jgi:cytochrome bd-type quinol oxidase subunit 2
MQVAPRDPTIPDTVLDTARSKRVTWAIVATSVVYTLMLAGGVALIVDDSGTDARDKAVACAVLVLLPALAYAAALAPLWHRSPSRVRLGAVASVAIVVAIVIAALTLGVAFR